jgi:hypothetical protein
VAIERVTEVGLLPGVIVADGENKAVVPGGSAETLNVTGLENVPFEGDTVRPKLAVWPAVTGGDELGALTA